MSRSMDDSSANVGLSSGLRGEGEGIEGGGDPRGQGDWREKERR